MLDLFRKRGLSSVVYGLIIVATVFVFVVQFRPNAGQKTASLKEACVVTVRGWCVDPKDYRAAYRLLMPRDQEGTPSPAQARKMGLSKIAVDGLIERELLLDEAQRIGLKVSDDEFNDQILGGFIRVSVPIADPVLASKMRVKDGMVYAGFKDKNKQFDMKVYTRTLRNLVGRSETEFREEQEREILAAKMRDLIIAPVRVSDSDAFAVYDEEKSTATVNTITIDQGWVEKWSAPPATADIDAWMADKVNSDEVDKTAATREADDLPLAGHVRQILAKLPPEPTEDDLHNAAVKLAAARARVAAGATFAEVARETSEDRGSSRRGGDLGDKMDDLLPQVRDAASALKPGQMSAAIQSPMGLHLVWKDDPAKADDVKAALHKDVAREAFRKAKANEKARDLATKLVADLKGGAKPEDAIAKIVASMPKLAASPGPMEIKRLPKESLDAGAEPDATVTTTAATVKKGEKKDAKEAAKPLTADTDPSRPQLVPSQPFGKAGEPVSGLAPDAQRKLVDFAYSGKEGEWDAEPIRAENGWVVAQLVTRKLASQEDFEKDKKSVIEQMVGAKRAEALALHVKRLRDEAKDEIKIDDSYLQDGKLPDGGAPPSNGSDEDEEGP
jgi:parvulin-like peptidyl-prolyl isomerase